MCTKSRFFDFQKETIPVKEWTEEHVNEWLMEKAVKKYQSFLDKPVNGAQLIVINRAALMNRFGTKVCEQRTIYLPSLD
jgi:hypothetical protein